MTSFRTKCDLAGILDNVGHSLPHNIAVSLGLFSVGIALLSRLFG